MEPDAVEPSDPRSTADKKAPDQAPDKDKELRRSFGNKVFDLVVWPTIQGAAVWALSYLIAYEGTKGKNPNFDWLRTGTKATSEWVAKAIKKPIETDFVQRVWKSSAKEWGHSWAMWGLVSIPGTLLTPVTQWIERYRRPISAHIDKVFRKTPDDPDSIKPEPKQTTSSMLAGRGMVVVGAATTHIAFGPKGMEVTGEKVGDLIAPLYKKFRPEVDISKGSEYRNKLGVGVFDMILTLGATAVMFFYSRHVARRQEEARLKQEVRELEAKTSAPALTPPSGPQEENKPSFTARTGDRPVDYRARASQQEPASSGIALS